MKAALLLLISLLSLRMLEAREPASKHPPSVEKPSPLDFSAVQAPSNPVPAAAEQTPGEERRTFEFQNDEVGLVLRTLARQAGISLFVDEDVAGTVTLRVEDKTPREMMEIVADVRDLVLEERSGVFYAHPKHPAAHAPASAPAFSALLTAVFLGACAGGFMASLILGGIFLLTRRRRSGSGAKA